MRAEQQCDPQMEASKYVDVGEGPPIDRVDVAAYTVPTETSPESDGTHEWGATTMVVVQAKAGDQTGLGYTYSHAAAAYLIDDTLAEIVEGRDALSVQASWEAMHRAIRNVGRPGLGAAAIAAVDTALWDLKARLLGCPLVTALDGARESVPVYGSGGFTSYSTGKLTDQLTGWVEEGISVVKMKVGRRPEEDLERVNEARTAVGEDVDLFVDANGAYSRKQALWFAEAFAELGVSWYEEPVSSDDLQGLRLLRDQGPPGLEVAAGEYGYDLFYFRRMLDAGAVDVLQADATRCAGITGFLNAGTLCRAHGLDLSAHTAPNLHAHAGCAAARVRHVEYFHDHVRIEEMFFDGALVPQDGRLIPDRSRPGLGLVLKERVADEYRVYP